LVKHALTERGLGKDLTSGFRLSVLDSRELIDASCSLTFRICGVSNTMVQECLSSRVSDRVTKALSQATHKRELHFYHLASRVLGGPETRRVAKTFYLKKQDRPIVAPTHELKQFHRAVASLLYKIGACKFKSCAIGSIKTRSRNSIPWDPYRRVFTATPDPDMVMLKLDLRRAFHSITADRVEAVFTDVLEKAIEPIRAIYQKNRKDYREYLTSSNPGVRDYRQIIFLLDLLPEVLETCTHRGRLPVGYSLSPLIFNLAVTSIDARILGAIDAFSKKNYQALRQTEKITSGSEKWKSLPARNVNVSGGTYFRYVDDLIILTNKNNKTLLNVVRKIVWSEGLELNEGKTRVVPFESGWSALGMAISSELCPPTKRLMKKMRGLWHRYKTHNDTKSYEILRGIVSSISPLGRRNVEVLKKLGLAVNEHGRKGKWDLIEAE